MFDVVNAIACSHFCGQAGGIIPDGVLFDPLRSIKTCGSKESLDAVIKLPGGVFKPYGRVSTVISIMR
jgi:type I restriction enzyme M protein